MKSTLTPSEAPDPPFQPKAGMLVRVPPAYRNVLLDQVILCTFTQPDGSQYFGGVSVYPSSAAGTYNHMWARCLFEPYHGSVNLEQ
jgi:hypothetical protein